MRKLILLALVLGLLGLGAFWFVTEPANAVARGDATLEQGGDAARGRAVFYAGGCASCHATPKQEDRLLLGGGLELKSPFGSFYAPNISPHPVDGIGRWSVADLANAMLAGVSPDGAHYYPAFPYASYARAKLEDVRDLMAFLRTLKPVEGRVRDHDLGFPFNVRRTLGVWKALYLDRTPLRDGPAQDASVNRGRYLVETLGHCAECHSARDPLGGIVPAHRLAGGPDPEGEGWVPNITPKGLKDWTRGDIMQLLELGLTPDGDSVGGSMNNVVRNMAELPKEDRAAIADYLLSLPPRDGPQKPAKK
ncbi:MAG: cycG [Hyphomicrobiales bacterium]|nr:cycG [Hyphomicrobiales bacterium]